MSKLPSWNKGFFWLQNLSIQKAFLIPTLFLILLGFGVQFFTVRELVQSNLLNLVIRENRNTADLANGLLTTWLDGRKLFLSGIAQDAVVLQIFEGNGVRSKEASEAMNAYLGKIPMMDPYSVQVGVVKADGDHIKFGDAVNHIKDLTYCRDYFLTKSKAAGLKVVRGPLGAYIEICSPIFLGDLLAGAVYSILDLNKFYSNYFVPITIGDAGFIYVVDREGNSIMKPENFTRDKWDFHSSNMVGFEKVNGQVRGSLKYLDNEGFLRLDSFVIFEPLNWNIVVSVVENELLAKVDDLGLVNILVTIFIATSVGIILMLISYLVVAKPLKKLTKSAVAISNGDLNHRISSEGSAEIRTLGKAFNSMTLAVAEQITVIKDQNDSLDRKVRARTVQLEEAQKQLIAQAHESGMAEIAVGVLHNIGNALVSVRTNLWELGQLAEVGAVEKVEKLYELLCANKDDLATFFSSPKGLSALEYLGEVVALLAKEKDDLDTLTLEMEDSIHHIDNVIHSQQEHAKGVHYVEQLAAEDLVYKAVNMQSSNLVLEGVNIDVKLLNHLEPIVTSRTMIMQVFINIIKNAAEAMKDNPTVTEGSLLIRIWQEKDRMYFSFRDTGPGIPEDMLDSIFSHGYTSKKYGNGYGLHSSAGFVMSLGGKMKAENVEGGGAVFTVELPLVFTKP